LNHNFFNLVADSIQLGFESQQVIGLRLIRMASGGAAAQTEATRMLTEKITAAGEAMGTLASGGSSRRIVRRYLARVKANRRRLSKGL